VPASASIEVRARKLCEKIEEKMKGREINIIGHSMGGQSFYCWLCQTMTLILFGCQGLDGRYLITHLKPTTFKVRSLTTIATPHRGSSFADYLIESLLGRQFDLL
jgi:triacylglycerol lipase